jgi:hypothetical protein
MRGFRFLLCLTIALGAVPAGWAVTERSVTAAPGSVVRWPGRGTTRCSMNGRSWSALYGVCYYPIDLQHKAGVVTVARQRVGRVEYARISVQPFDYGEERIELPDIPQAHPSPEDLQRAVRETALQGRIFHRAEGPARFSLPLGPPAKPLPPCKDFGVHRIYNDKPDPEPHMGVDCPVPEGSPLLAVAAGRVVLAQDLFFGGNGVFIDHGNGLFSVYFHLARIDVSEGEEVQKGHTLGTVGSTGRSTGPHLFFALRWHDASIDPRLLWGRPTEMTEIPSL